MGTTMREINERLMNWNYDSYKSRDRQRRMGNAITALLRRQALLDQAVRNITGANIRRDLGEVLALGIYLQGHAPAMHDIRAEYSRLSTGGK